MTKVQCPKCAEEGRDTRKNNATVYPNGSVFCHAGHGKIQKEESLTPKSTLTVHECMDNPRGHDPTRKIPPEILDMYDIRFACDETTGQPKRVYYPYYAAVGSKEVTGVKIRTLPKTFFVAGKLQGVFGKQACRGSKFLMITEGEEDALALKTILLQRKADWDVVSIPNGATMDGKLDAAILADQGFFGTYHRIYLVLDQDQPGRSTAKRLANWLSGFVENIFTVDLPFKDAAEGFIQGKGKEVTDAIKATKPYMPEGIVHGKDINLSDVLRPRPRGLDSPFVDLDAKLRGFRKAEITTVCAGSGIGKSTLVREIGYDLVTRHKQSVCHITLENSYEDTCAAYIAMYLGVPPAVFMMDPGKYKPADVEAAADNTIRKMLFFNHFGSIEKPSFMEKIRYYARIGVDYIILDHLSMIVSGLDSQNERKDIDKIMTDLASTVVETGVGLINVVHLKRQGSDSESYNTGGEVGLTDLRGSAALEQLSWNVIAMERNQQAEDGEEDYSTLRILKNRMWGSTGRAGKVRFDHPTGRLVPVIPETVHPIETPEEVVNGP